ncbi:MAG: hypothetical protein ACLKAN_12695 [Alkaliphilus sp.]
MSVLIDGVAEGINLIEKFLIKECEDRINDEEIKEFERFCEEKKIFTVIDHIEDDKEYNFYDIKMRLDETNSATNCAEIELYDQIDSFLKRDVV